MQSSTKRTGCSKSSLNRFAQGAKVNSGLRSPFGRPKCDAITTFAPWSIKWRNVGKVARIRVSSVITPSFRGTLKSTRTNTVLFATFIFASESFILSPIYLQ